MIFGKSDEQLKKELEENQAELKKLQDALAASQNDTRIQVEARQADADRIQELSDENDSLKKEIERLVNIYSYAKRSLIVIVYAARVAGGELCTDEECLEAGLFAPGEIPWDRLAFHSTTQALREYLDSTSNPARLRF